MRLVSPSKISSVKGAAVGLVLSIAISATLVPFRGEIGQVAPTSIFLIAVIAIGVFSTLWGALFTSAVSGGLLNFLFMHPYGSFKIAYTEDVVGFIAYYAAAITVSFLIDAWASSKEQIVVVTTRAERDEAKLSWLNYISHDVRTPLSTINAVISDLRDDVPFTDEMRADLLMTAKMEVDRLDRLLANWLTLASLEESLPHLRPVAIDVVELCENTIEHLSPLLKTHRVILHEPQGLAIVDGDYQLLQQAMTNLLVNAVKHSEESSRIEVTVTVIFDGVVIMVDDDGSGFPATGREDLLKPFVRASSTSTGLGLALCAAVVGRHQGTIALGDSPLGGAQVKLTFPIRRNPMSAL
jgi:K+-sensing histidine kinase KdpD